MKRLQFPSFSFVWPGRRSDRPATAAEIQWRQDPLSHPDIRSMSERERADLQFNPEIVDSE
jgi:hypothetical protein